MNEKVFILGAGGHTRSLMALLAHNNILPEGIYDDSFDPEIVEIIHKTAVKGKIAQLPEVGKIIISYGDLKQRARLYKAYKERIMKENLIHPSAIIEINTELGEANQIFGNVIINAYSIIGKNNIINTGCIIEHENEIGDNCHISIGSVLGGRVKIGDRCFIGAGATVIDKISICDDVILGANATVINDIDSPGTYVGNPVRKIK